MAVLINKLGKNVAKPVLTRVGAAFFAFLFFSASPAFALTVGNDLNKVAENITVSGTELPGMISGFAYLLALLFAVTGVLKLKDHVSNPTQTHLRTPIIRFIIGGALLALPAIYTAMSMAIDGGAGGVFDPGGSLGNSATGALGALGNFVPTGNFNEVLSSIIASITHVPTLIAALSYLLALVLGVAGLLKIKEHVEEPERAGLKDGVVRLLAGGALFALPTLYRAMYTTIAGGGTGIMGNITSLLGTLGLFNSGYAGSGFTCGAGSLITGALGSLPGLLGIGNSSTMGQQLCGLITGAGAFPAFLTALGYLFGLVLGVWGVLKLKDHVVDPNRTTVWEGFSRLIAGGAFFAMPFLVEVIKNTVAPSSATFGSAVGSVLSSVGVGVNGLSTISGYNEKAAGCTGLDGALYCMMHDIMGPLHLVLNLFCACAGTIFLMIGISRLTKGAQEGARGPGGLGTIMTFLTAGALLSSNALMRAATATLTGSNTTLTKATLSYKEGLSGDELMHAHTVISAIIKFMIIVGLISFVRGLFIIRGVAEGSQQASIMAGLTHVVGGALAVNMGPLINFVQATLGISGYGVVFS